MPCIWLSIVIRVHAHDYIPTWRSVDSQLPDRDTDLIGEIGEVVKFLQFRWLDNLRAGTRFKPDLEVGFGDVVKGFRVPGIKGERTGGRFEV